MVDQMKPTKKKQNNLLQKFMFREVYGEVRECRSKACEHLFQQLPHRLAFSLSQLAPNSAFTAGHIFLGFTKCGQFILSYTHSCDTDDHTLQMVHRYCLHWWLFTPYAQLRKVAEVMLFGDQDLQESIYENIYIAVCQWPKDLSRILVYGCSLDEGESTTGPQTRRVYITITAVPSLDNCSACFQVATSYEEEDLAERWNSCARFSCLQHGITVHTSFEMVPPFPRFMPSVQLKLEGHVVLNAGNFIHVLSVNLENMGKKSKNNDIENLFDISVLRTKKEFNNCPLIDAESEDEENSSQSKNLDVKNSQTSNSSDHQTLNCDHNFNSSDNEQAAINESLRVEDISSDKLRVSLRDKHSSEDKDREWEILIGSTPNHNRTLDVCKTVKYDMDLQGSSVMISAADSDIRSVDSDCSSQSGDIVKNFSYFSNQLPDDSPYLSVYDDTADSDDSMICTHSVETSQASQQPIDKINSLEVLPNEFFVTENLREDSNSPKTDNKEAEKEYEFIDEITEGRYEKLSVFRRRRLAEKKYEFSDENSENFPENYRSFRSQSRRLILSPSRSPRLRNFSKPLSELSVELGENSSFFRSVYEKLLSPSSGSMSPIDVLRPINQNITSPVLSPREDKWRDDSDKNGIQRSSSRESLPICSPLTSQRLHDLNSFHFQNGTAVTRQAMKCVVDIKRRYIEIDDELVSIITDIEDDELSSATGYHNALSLEVHGSGYTQMHMISNSKAEKLMVPGVFVRQVSLDVEQFCHETAQKLCNESGKKYYFCNDYNVEIVDVCPTSKNVIALASVLVQAGSNKHKAKKGAPYRNLVGSQNLCNRKLYKATATFVFNIDTKLYYILDKEPLVEENPYNYELSSEGVCDSEHCEGNWWVKARFAARQLRTSSTIPTDYFSSVKVMTNEALLKGKSLTHIMEGYHHVALILGNQNNS